MYTYINSVITRYHKFSFVLDYDGIYHKLFYSNKLAPWATKDDDAPSARFRARFRRGARMDILRSEAWPGGWGCEPYWGPSQLIRSI